MYKIPFPKFISIITDLSRVAADVAALASGGLSEAEVAKLIGDLHQLVADIMAAAKPQPVSTVSA